MAQPVVLLTGASSGIGLALAQKLHVSSFRVAVTAREKSIHTVRAQLPETDRFGVFPLDVTCAESRERLVADVRARFGGVDILINNAGISYRSVIEHMTEADEALQMGTNYFGPLGLIRLCLPHMRERRAGRIINVSSVGGMMAMPTMGSYSASKFALEGASEALWYELQPWNIKVTLVQPGFIRSRSFEHVYFSEAGKQASEEHRDAYHAYYRSMSVFIETLMCRAFATSDSVAQTVLDLMMKENPPLRHPATIDATFFSVLRRFVPRKLYHRILYANLPDIKKWGVNEEESDSQN
ncbi:MAG: SDR family oxidoreductase [Bdellovibrionota bacterium]